MSENSEANQRLLEGFAEKFDPPLLVFGTQNIGGKPVQDGFMCAYYDSNTGVGVTGLAFGKGKFKAYLEVTEDGAAEKSGDLFAEILKRF